MAHSSACKGVGQAARSPSPGYTHTLKSLQLLPSFEQAVIPIEKLRDYVLNTEHPQGCNKAKVFRDLLAIEQRHCAILAELLRSSLSRSPAQVGEADEYGQRWTTYHLVVGLNGNSAVITVAWIVKEPDRPTPELVTCYIESRRQKKLLELFD